MPDSRNSAQETTIQSIDIYEKLRFRSRPTAAGVIIYNSIMLRAYVLLNHITARLYSNSEIPVNFN